MHIKRRRGWEIPEHLATPEAAYLNRRELIAAGGLALLGGLVGRPRPARAETDPTADLYPAPRNSRYTIGRAVTPESVNTDYNNFFEFGMQKNVAGRAQILRIRPWEIRIDGLVEKDQILGVDDLIRRFPLEERLYRHRAVEAWSMTVPWTGFPLASLVELAKPLASAKYLRMEAFLDPETATGQRQFWFPWPYVEALTIAEATNELAFVVTGAYGKPVAKSMGAPLRVHLPWKYGFKSIKSIARFTFAEDRPDTFWQQVAPDACGFWANVNPEVPHPRWSQASERDISTGERIPTRLFNGYGDFVAALYSDAGDERLYM
jgi:sulfoxide reductase catalytic subunit YedY